MTRPLRLLIFPLFSLAIPILANASASDCCVGRMGNVDGSPSDTMDIADLTLLIDNLFISLNPLSCPAEANLDESQDGQIDIADLTRMIDLMFIHIGDAPLCMGGGTVSDQERATVIGKVDSVMHAIKNLPLAQANDLLLQYVQSRPEYGSSGKSGSSVWARFVDGVLHIMDLASFNDPVMNMPKPTRKKIVSPFAPQPDNLPLPTQFKPFEPSTITPGRVRTSFNNKQFPASARAKLFTALGPYFAGVDVYTDSLVNMLAAQGYNATRLSATVAQLKTIGGEGIVYMITHGAMADSVAGHAQYGVWTSTPYDPAATPNPYQSDLLAGRLCYYSAIYGFNADSIKTHLAITSKFVDTYWGNLANHSMFYANCSWSNYDTLNPFVQSVLAKNAGVFLGWTDQVTYTKAIELPLVIFDLLLGANKIEPVAVPPNRPFPFDQVFAYIEGLAINLDPSYVSLLIPTMGQVPFEILVPTLAYVSTYYPYNDEIYIDGSCGPLQGNAKVKLNGQELQILDWGVIAIKCKYTGITEGDIVVEIPSPDYPGHFLRSNPIPMTGWRIPFTFTHTESGTLKITCNLVYHIVADIHPYRDQPYGELYKSIVYARGSNDVQGSISATGTATQSQFGITTTVTWSGSRIVPYQFNAVDGYYGAAIIDMVHNTFELQPYAYVGGGMNQHVHVDSPPLPPQDSDNQITWWWPVDFFDTLATAGLFLPLNDNLNLNSETREKQGVSAYSALAFGGVFATIKMQLPDVTVVNPPNVNDPVWRKK